MAEEHKKKHLIITSSGGGGHTAAAETIKAELINKGIKAEEIEIIDLMGLYEKGNNKGDPWIPTISLFGTEVFSGPANTKTWNDLQAKGGADAPRKLESLTEKQWMAEVIQNPTVHSRLKKYLEENDVQAVYNTQALSAAPICRAVREFNDKSGKNEAKRIKIAGIVTEFLTDYATHFTGSLRSIAEEDRKDLVMRSIAPPLRDPGESRTAFEERHGLKGIEFQYASEDQNAPSPVNPLYTEGKYFEEGKLQIKAASAEEKESEGKRVRNEKAFVEKQLGQSLTDGPSKGHFSMTIDHKKDVVNFLTLGSQGSEAMFDYIDTFLEQSINNKHDGKVFLFITTSKNESTAAQKCMYHKALDHLASRIEEYEAKGIQIPENAKVIPLAFQDQENMASLMQNARNLIVRTGGMTAMQARESKKDDTRQVIVHCETHIPSIESFPVDNPDAKRELLQSGLVQWEKGNADRLILEANGSLGGPQTINFGFGNEQAGGPASLFKAAYDTYIEEPGTKEMRLQDKKEGILTLTSDYNIQISKLISEGSNPNLQFPAGSYLIDHCADFNTMKLLVEHGAKLTEKSLDKTWLDEAQKKVLQDAEKQFKKDFKAGKSQIHEAFAEAVKDGKVKEVKGLMYNFDSIKDQKITLDGQSLTPIQIAIKNKHPEVLQALLGKGAVAEPKMLHYAIEAGNSKAVEILLQRGVNPHVTYKGKKPYELLEDHTNKTFAGEVLKLFVKEKVLDPDIYVPHVAGVPSESLQDIMYERDNKYQNSDIHRAVYYLNKEQEEFKRQFPGQTLTSILDKNAGEINGINKKGLSPIALCKDQKVRRELVRYGAAPDYAVGITPAERKELDVIYKEYKDITENTYNVISQIFEQSKTQEEFSAAIMAKFAKMYAMEPNGTKKLQAQEENIKRHCNNAYDSLKLTETEVGQKPIFAWLKDKLYSLVGKGALDKVIETESKTLGNSLKNIQNTLNKHTVEPKGHRVLLPVKPPPGQENFLRK